ncbi:hypothetical protein [Crocosphaera sp.]|uniref:hypothetical protein n=1 Tax=Crocosphaera sp. TaxID=2729996 RepID=UPI003F592587
MLSQFRQHYPKGSLVSELVTIDHGQYIVRVLLQHNGVTLGTGLAADNKVEIAEDRARERALNSLILDHKPLEISTSENLNTEGGQGVEQAEPIVSLPSETPPSKPKVEVSSPPPEKPLEPVAKQEEIKAIEEEEEEVKPSIQPTEKTPVKSSKDRVKTASKPKKSKPVEPEIEEELLPITEAMQEPAIEENTLPIDEIAEETETDEDIPVVEEVLDFSEIIARSNAELKRLKWTTEQGREYLIRTYGKRSRQVLSDEELLEFLRYLESLPTPS